MFLSLLTTLGILYVAMWTRMAGIFLNTIFNFTIPSMWGADPATSNYFLYVFFDLLCSTYYWHTRNVTIPLTPASFLWFFNQFYRQGLQPSSFSSVLRRAGGGVLSPHSKLFSFISLRRKGWTVSELTSEITAVPSTLLPLHRFLSRRDKS